MRVAHETGGVDWNPIVDGRVLAEQPLVVFRSGQQAKVPVMVGSNLDEVSIFASPLVGGRSYRPQTVSEYREWLKRKFGDQADAVFQAYPAAQDGEVAAAFRGMDTDWSFGFGSQLLAREVAASGEKAYLYIFTMTGRGPFASLGAFHSLESMYLSKHYWTDWVKDPHDEALSDAIIGYWTSFAAKGTPSAAGLPAWAAYREDKPEAQELGRHIGPVRVPRMDAMKVFAKVLERRRKPGSEVAAEGQAVVGCGAGVGRVAGLAREGEGGPVAGAGGEGEDGEREEEDEVVDDDLDERGADEEGAEGAEQDCAAVAL